MKNGLKRDAFTVKNGGIFNTPILISKAEIRKSLVPSRFQSIEKEPQLQYISYHNYGSYLAAGEGFEPSHTESESAVKIIHRFFGSVNNIRSHRCIYFTGHRNIRMSHEVLCNIDWYTGSL